MIQNINWNNIRSINGSQKEGFEELVCQLARNEKIENSKYFTRKGTPDAGVECFWVLEDDSEVAWQAKFFTSSLGSTQWSEIDKSVKTMLEKHPKTKKYIISIPQDRADARVKGQKSFLQKWNDRVTKWEKWAKEKELDIDFVYEGSSELLNKLSLPLNVGKLSFWFGKNEFNNDWFKQQNDNKIDDLGARYSPEINVELNIKYVFEGLYYDSDFQEKIKSEIKNVFIGFNSFLKYLEHVNYENLYNDVENLQNDFNNAISSIDIIGKKTYKKAKSIFSLTRVKLISYKQSFIEKEKIVKEKENNLEYESRKLVDSIYNCINYCSHFDSTLAENPYLLIEGEAGIGKSHLIADVILEKYNSNQYSILLLGQHFNQGNIWSQIFDELDLKLSKNEFLGALNSKAESTGSRIIIFIDAINEGEGKYLWKDRLISFIKDFKAFEFLGLVLSIRSTYKDIVLPEKIYNELEHFTHRGLDDNPLAIKTFFDYYKIEEPPVPILNPEFSNPLFLKLFCKGLSENGYNKIPSGYEGISTIFDFVINAANKAMSDRLDYDYKMFDLVSEAVKILVEKIVESPSLRIFKSEAYKCLTEQLKNHVSDSRKILTELINENIINENVLFNTETGKYDREIIYFSYEKFGDHLIIDSLLKRNEVELLKYKKITPEMKLYDFIKDENSTFYYQGFIDAMSIQIPEKFDLELYELVPDNKVYHIGESFLNSLVWRKNSSVKDKVRKYINSYITTVKGLNEQLKNLLIQLSIKKGHFFNARFLDNYLFKMSLSDRDYHWTIFINDSEHQMPFTIVDWCRESKILSKLDEETKRLLSLCLSWLLTSSNRILRDSATKSLVRLFENDLLLLKELIEHLKDVNDTYVIERLYAVAYGASVRTTFLEQLKDFSIYIYKSVFKDKTPYEHLLLRDYARGVIEYAIHKGIVTDIDAEDIRPPYNSKLPKRLPSQKFVERFDIDRDKDSITQNQLYDYVMGSSDFARYTIGTNGYSKISKTTVDSFISYSKLRESLKEEKLETLDTIHEIVKNYHSEFVKKEYKKILKEFINRLEDDLQMFFNVSESEAKSIVCYLNNSVKANNIHDKKGRFELAILQRLIIKDVFTVSKWDLDYFMYSDFRKFDYFNKKSFSSKEAIGKKYIWIAYYKWLAIIFDNYLVSGDYSTYSEYGFFKGTWQHYKRDIDPTMTLKEGIIESKYKRDEETFWSPQKEISISNSNEHWVFDKSDMSNPKKLIEVVDSKGESWLNLLAYPSWRKKYGENNGESRDIWYHIKSFVVKKEKKNDILEALKGKSFFNHSIPQEQQIYEVYSREYYWSNAYDDVSYSEEPQLLHSSFENDDLKGQITSVQLTWYSDRDFSLNQAIHIHRPSKIIYDILDLTFEENEYEFYDSKTGELILYNTALKTEKGFESVLVKKNVLLDKLNKEGLDIIWCVLGAKEVIASNTIINESHLNNVFYFDDEQDIKGELSLEKARFD